MRSAASRPRGKFYLPSLGILPLGIRFGILCLTLVCVPACRAQASSVPDARSIARLKYETLKTRVMGNDLTVDWSEFRASAAQAGLGSYDWHPARQRVLNDLDAGRLPAALGGAQTVIAHNMADPEGHLLAMTVYRQMGMESAADRERSLVDALVHSILGSGDGLSAPHAWSTVSAGEEDFIVMMVLDADTESQTTVRSATGSYDRITARAADGTERVLWFTARPSEHTTLSAVVLPKR